MILRLFDQPSHLSNIILPEAFAFCQQKFAKIPTFFSRDQWRTKGKPDFGGLKTLEGCRAISKSNNMFSFIGGKQDL
jgi:hypothetical protein